MEVWSEGGKNSTVIITSFKNSNWKKLTGGGNYFKVKTNEAWSKPKEEKLTMEKYKK